MGKSLNTYQAEGTPGTRGLRWDDKQRNQSVAEAVCARTFVYVCIYMCMFVRRVVENELSVPERWQIIEKVTGSLALTLNEIHLHHIEDLGAEKWLDFALKGSSQMLL